MLKIVGLMCALLLGGCATAPENQVKVTITNSTLQPLVIRVGSSILSTAITIPPGMSWSGVVDRRWLSTTGWIKIEPLLKVE